MSAGLTEVERLDQLEERLTAVDKLFASALPGTAGGRTRAVQSRCSGDPVEERLRRLERGLGAYLYLLEQGGWGSRILEDTALRPLLAEHRDQLAAEYRTRQLAEYERRAAEAAAREVSR